MVSRIAGQTPARTARRSSQSYRDVDELLAERGVEVDHVTVYRWVQRFTLLLIDAARPCRHAPGDRWFADETYVKIDGRWVYLYRAIDQYGQASMSWWRRSGTWQPLAGSSPEPSNMAHHRAR